MIKKLILGTANFDLNYGVKNKYKKLRIKEIKKIIIYLKKKILATLIQPKAIITLKKYLEKKMLKNLKLLQNLTFPTKIIAKTMP